MIETVQEASARLPERQREALELHEREGLSYDEIAARLETSWSSVAQLVAHARINFYDELRGTILASMAPSSDCERAPCLIAARQDGELDPDSAEAAWLDAHLAECQRCERGVEEMRAASAAYRGSGATAAAPGDPPAPAPRRRLALALAAAALLLFAGVAAAFVRNDSPGPAEPAAEVADRSRSATPGAASKGTDGKKARSREAASKAAGKKGASSDATGAAVPPASPAAPTTSEVPVAVPGADPPTGGGGSASRPSGDTAVDPPQRTTAPKPKPAPTATSSPTPSAAPAPAPAPVSEPTTEPSPTEPTQETSRRREPPGKPAHAGPK